jgi:hypothetical protein
MIRKISRRQFLVYSALAGAGMMTGRVSFASTTKGQKFFFAVMSDPHSATDSWVNALTEARNLTVNPDPEYGAAEFLLVTGDTNPIDKRYEDYTSVFEGVDAPFFLPTIGNHEADDSGGFPGGMGSMGPGGQGGGQPPSGQGGMQPPEGQGEAGQPPQGEMAGQGDQTGMGTPSGGQSDMGTPPGGQQGQNAPQGGSSDGAVVQVAGQRPGMYPNDGNPNIIDMEFIRDNIVTAIPNVVRMSDGACSYYCDHKNVRMISIDAYSGEAGTGGIISDDGRAWTEAVIKSAPATIDHIFIAYHSPAFPRMRHTHDSFNSNPEQRNAFWKMLVSQREKVKAVFCGHTHSYARMRVLDPAGEAANDLTAYPDEAGGIYQVNVGSTGNGMKNTFVRVCIDGEKVCFRAYEAENGKDKPWTLKEEWCV